MAQQADPHYRRGIISEGALSLFNLVIRSYSEEVALLEAAANMMLCVAMSIYFVRMILHIYIDNISYLTTNDQEAGRLFIPSAKLILTLLSKISHANADAVASQAIVMQLYCALLHENLLSTDDADDMQVSISWMQRVSNSYLTHFRALVVLRFLCEQSTVTA